MMLTYQQRPVPLLEGKREKGERKEPSLAEGRKARTMRGKRKK
jgi:hypothetical protein